MTVRTPEQGERATRRYAVGAEPAGERGTHFRVWAPASKRVSIVERFPGSDTHGRTQQLDPEADGYHAGFFQDLRAPSLYSVALDSGLYPDPASRFQPE